MTTKNPDLTPTPEQLAQFKEKQRLAMLIKKNFPAKSQEKK